jgi:1-deoxy-D-xylulose-5-phosphate reductoisomerase
MSSLLLEGLKIGFYVLLFFSSPKEVREEKKRLKIHPFLQSSREDLILMGGACLLAFLHTACVSMIHLTLLGSTGSIGTSTLEVLALHPKRFQIFALTAQQNVSRMLAQCVTYAPRYVVMQNTQAAEELARRLKAHNIDTQVLSGNADLAWVASHPEVDYVMAGIVGAAGLLPTLAAAQAGKRILLANKEALVMAGHLFMQTLHRHHATLLPVDSEHSAIFQSLPADFKVGHSPAGVKKIVLTASGGAFRDWPLEALVTATPAQACAHPNWQMGNKITVDSATMMNKGLEVIEAHWLFGMPATQIETVLHPQSILHSWVEYLDGSLIAQLGQPDMRTPIAYALSWPERISAGVESLDLCQIGQLDFKPLSLTHYPCLELAYAALRRGGTASTSLNAANEIAVQAFLAEKIRFTDIFKVVETCLEQVSVHDSDTLENIMAADKRAREESMQIIEKFAITP